MGWNDTVFNPSVLSPTWIHTGSTCASKHRGTSTSLRSRPCPNPLSIYREIFRVFKGVCWLGAQKRSEKIFKFFPPSFYMIIPLIPNHLIFTTWDTSIVVAPSKRNILTQTRVDIGSAHRDDPYETIMLELSILFFPPVVRTRECLFSGRFSPKVGSDRYLAHGWKKYYR